MYMWLITTIIQKKKLNVAPFQNGGQITDFYFASFRFWPKFENHFSEGIFQRIWAHGKTRRHEQIYIAEIKMWNFYSWVI